ncbi:glycosyltransferase family 1 protein [Paenibacillaceae bacterium]|nr:glycosyltransferase family 1 protein [Paenibacillaceae bacterium]
MSKSRPKVLIIGPVHLPSFKIGISLPFRHLRRKGVLTFETKSEQDITKETIAAVDIVVFVRSYSPGVYRFLKLANQLNKKTVYCIDDHFLAIPKNTPLGKVYHQPENKRAYLHFIQRSSVVRAPSQYFANYIRKHYRKKNVVSFPGCVDFSLFDKLKKPASNKSAIVIGYAGGPKPDAFGKVVPAMRRILKEYPSKVRLEFFGYTPPALAGHKNVRSRKSITDYREFVKELYTSGWDIGLAPLQNTLLHNCKTNNKFREYAACSIAGVYSDSPAYAGSVTHQENGIIVQDTEEGWYRGIKLLIDNPQLRKGIQKNAYKTARSKFNIDVCAEKWRKMLLR